LNSPHDLPALPLPEGIRTRHVNNHNGLDMHVLEAGWQDRTRPALLLLHGFPELAYSWRKVMLPLAHAGFHVIAPDQRGYGRTTGWDPRYDADLAPSRMLNLARDAVGLVHAMGRRSVQAVIGHDFGSPVAGWCALVRPDVFRSVVLMSAPFGGPPALPFDTADGMPGAAAPTRAGASDPSAALAALPRPRKHYQWYYSTREADGDMRNCPQGVHAFLRAYYHHKSADWAQNRPYPLARWEASELAKMPTYYVMDRDETMPQTVAHVMPTDAQIAACRWLPDDEMRVYSTEYTRTGFQGGLQWYRCGTSGRFASEMQLYGGRPIDVPSSFIAGSSDWGVYQKPGELERMRTTACTDMRSVDLVDGAGHWVQQEQPQAVVSLLRRFLSRIG
jgi:pimeloyl-ACP methyl ester carboxylesterase